MIFQELKGPPNYSHRRVCRGVFMVGLVFVGVCLPPWLIEYADKIMNYNAMCSDQFGFNAYWAFRY